MNGEPPQTVDGGTIGLGPAPPVAVQVERGTLVESVHRAHIAVVDAQGALVAWAGQPHVLIAPRSALKPLLAAAMVDLGFAPRSPEQLAVAASSHSGEQMHVDAVKAILHDADLADHLLSNTADWPFDDKVRDEWIAQGGSKDRLHANCSGKHAGMLATCAVHGWAFDDYLAPTHLLQQELASRVSGLTGCRLAAPLIDGCGAPVWPMALSCLARGFAVLATSESTTAPGAVAAAMRAHPEYVGGSHRDVTELMRAVPGLVAKDGADAVYAAGLPEGRGVAIKVEDGGGRARPAVIAGTLAALGVPAQTLEPIERWEVVRGGGEPVGVVRSRVSLQWADASSNVRG